MLDNPILYREWVALRRIRSGSLLARLTYPTLLVVPTLMMRVLNPHSNWRDAAEIGFAISLFLHCLFVTLRAISGTVATVAWEKERRSFDALTATPLKPGQLLLGKYLASQAPLLFELALYSPAWLVFVAMDAARMSQLAQLALLTLGLQLFFSSLGLWASFLLSSAEQAGRFVYGLLGLLTVGTGLVYLIFELIAGMEDGPGWVLTVNPFFAAGSIVWVDSDFGEDQVWLWFSLMGLGLAPLLLADALRHFARPISLATRRRLAPVKGSGPEAPVAYRAWLAARRGGWRWTGWLLYPALLLGPSLATGAFSSQRSSLTEGTMYGGLVAHFLYFSLLALAGASARISRERERGTWDALLGTLLTGRELYRQQLSAVTRPLMIQLLVSSPLLFLFISNRRVTVEQILGIVLFTLVSIYFWSALGLYVSERAPSSLRALQIAVGCLALVVIVPIWLDVMISETTRHRDFMVFCYVDPLIALLSFSEGFASSTNGLRQYLGLICTAIYSLGFFWLARKGARFFDRAAGV